ncbi:MAG: hypothetical protein JJU46_00340 [Balneolaceae bacterium]|nr:hypothetical protein [Balneolaceae bacterium]MCH8550097.1 hypothetical protein [Balneolaceae bacterium]
MYGEDVAIIAIVFGSVLSIVFIGVLGSIIKTAIKRKSGDISENKEFLAALREFKEKTDRRLSNLEAIVAGDQPGDSVSSKTSDRKKEGSREHGSSIEIELNPDESKDKSGNSGKIKNMLNQ